MIWTLTHDPYIQHATALIETLMSNQDKAPLHRGMSAALIVQCGLFPAKHLSWRTSAAIIDHSLMLSLFRTATVTCEAQDMLYRRPQRTGALKRKTRNTTRGETGKAQHPLARKTKKQNKTMTKHVESQNSTTNYTKKPTKYSDQTNTEQNYKTPQKNHKTQ